MELPRFNVVPVILLILLLFLQYRLWFQSGGIADMIHLKKRLAAEQLINEKLKQRNDELFLQIQGLQKNQDAMESRARSELGMIKKGETFYQVVN